MMKEISRFSTRMLGTALSCLLLVAFALAGEQSPQEILQIEKDPGQNPWTHSMARIFRIAGKPPC